MAQKDDTERRIYALPAELLTRVRAYQNEDAISSEVEAVRRLLDSALQMRDTIYSLMAKLKAKYAGEKNLRVLARDILSVHPLVVRVEYEDGAIEFVLRGGYAARMTSAGELTFSLPDDGADYWRSYESYLSSSQPASPPLKRAVTGGWDSRPSNDLDDEIPF